MCASPLPIGNGFGHPAVVEIVVVITGAAKMNDIERFSLIVVYINSTRHIGARRDQIPIVRVFGIEKFIGRKIALD
jgi:hypothetical protein